MDTKIDTKLNTKIDTKIDMSSNIMKESYNNIKNTLMNIKKSVVINYKSWIVLLISILIITKNDLLKGFLTFFFMLMASHLFHYSCHTASYTNSVHVYHHNHNNYLSHISQIILELFSILNFIFIKHLFSYFAFLNEWVIIFYYFFYTTVHNVNYSIFHVNNIHEIHHKLQNVNLGPDICDIIFQTKFDVNDINSLENTNHYIYNILYGLLLVTTLQLIWKHATNNEKNIITNLFVGGYGIVVGVLLFLTIYFNFVD
jgi:hypothetical protein